MMKRRLFLLLGFGFVFIIAILAVIIYWPGSTEALNPDHGNCSICHSIHNSPGQSLTNDAVVEVLCLSCHGPAGTATKKAEVHKNKDGSSYSFFMTCPDCHDPHDHRGNWLGGTNLAQVGKKLDATGNAMIPTPNSGDRYVVFVSRGTDAGGPSLHSFADNDEDINTYYDGACETCHTLVLNHRNNSSGNHSHYTGTNCIVCHAHDGFFHGAGGGCIGCHSSPKGSRRAVAGEFALTSHHVLGGAVTDDDCGVCHYEAQGAHADGNVDLLDPDTGGRLTPFVAFSRNTASDSLESWVTDVQDNLCLKCHDADGATATNFSGDPMQPFSSADRVVPNVFARFATSNDYHHAVRGAGNNTYCNSNTMELPWCQGDHDVISCFDCHEAGGHGSSNQRMLRTAVDFDAMEAGTLSAALGSAVQTFCGRCHKSSVYVNGSAGSRFESHRVNKHSSTSNNPLGCMGCHAGTVDLSGLSTTNGATRGNIHGGSYTWTSNSPTNGTVTDHFILGGYISGWTAGVCYAGTCSHTGSPKTY